MITDENYLKIDSDITMMKQVELINMQKTDKEEIDLLFYNYYEFERTFKNQLRSLKEIEQDNNQLIEISESLERKINAFFITKNNLESDGQLVKKTVEPKIPIKKTEDNSTFFDSSESVDKILKQNRLTESIHPNDLKNKLQESNNLKKALDESSIISITDKQGNFVYVNKLFEEISEYSRNELFGKSHSILDSNYHPDEFFKYMWKVISNGLVWKGDIKNKSKNGKSYWVKTTIVPLLGQDDKPEQYFGISTDITKQKELEIKLSDALEEIKKTDELKNEFASMITHELKTPLTPIRGYCEILKDESFGSLNDDQREFLNTIEQNAHRLERLIGDVLDVQKLDMGKMTFHKSNVDVDELLKNIDTNVAPLLQEKEIQFIIPHNVNLNILTDKFRLQEIFENLIRNSIDFTPKHGKIEIGIQNKIDNVVFSVSDTGKGIPKEKQSNIFKKFFQGDTSQTRKHGGTGLGLVICKGIVEGLGGKIWFESQEDLGTTFSFTIQK